MSIITISRSFCSKGKIIAEHVANELGYECLSREILIEASDQFNIPEIKLAKAIHDGPSVFERFNHGKEKYITFIRAALLNHFQKNNIVYHGLAGHFFIQNHPNILKVRTLCDMEDRVNEEMEREHIPATIARKRLLNDDKARHNWSKYMYKMDTSAPELYDLVLNLKHMSINDCVKIILNAVELEQFQLSDNAKRNLKDEALAATVKATLVEKYPDATVTVHEGKVIIDIECLVINPEKTNRSIKNILRDNKMQRLTINVKSSTLPRTVMHKAG